MNKRSVSVIGLDGLGRLYLNKMVNSGEMPNLKYIVTSADVNTNIYCFPPETASSWPSLMSGVNLGKHGIYDFFKYNSERTRLFNALDLGHPRIHEMIAILKHFVLMINPVPSYPIIPVSNTMHVISFSFFTPKPTAYPKFLQKYLTEYRRYTYKSLNDFLIKYIDDLDYRIGIIENLVQKFDYKLIWVNFEIPDRILHLASERERKFKVLDKTVLKHEKIIFRKLDSVIKLLKDITDNVVIVSDHGFSYYNKTIAVNTILYKHGFIKLSEKGLSSSIEKYSKLLPEENKPLLLIPLNNPLVKIVRKPVLKHLAKAILKIYENLFEREIKLKFPEVDHKESKAFLFGETSFGIILNKKKYNVSPVEIVKILEKYKGIKHVWLKDQIFSGPYLKDLPDIYLYPDFDMGYWITDLKVYDKIYRRKCRLHHHPLGVFIMKDLGGYKILNEIINNTAVASLIMGWLGFPLSSWIDDKELVEKVFNGNVKYTDKYINLWNLNKRIFAMRFLKSRK
ncbi:alkaline phosphatase family protein [Staphylothermus marinus]|nr:alkaline phosphatase family protein [Staphylothermus marinus]